MENKFKIKITFFLYSLQTGGTELSTVRLIKGLTKRNFQIFLVLAKRKGELLKDIPHNVEVIDLRAPCDFITLFKFAKYLKDNPTDIVFSALPRINIFNILAKNFSHSKSKFIISERSTFSKLSSFSARKISHKFLARFIFPILIKIFYPQADAILCVSKGVADDLKKIIGNSSKIRTIYNPTFSEEILELSQEPVFDEWFVKKDLPIVLAVGRLNKVKDYPTLLKAFVLVLKSIPARLVIIGEGEERRSLEKLIKKLDLFENVKLLGLQRNPYKYMAKADVFVLSSIIEGFPNVLVEAMACGTPVISTDCESGPNEIIENGKDGFLVKIRDEKALSEAIIKLLKDFSLRYSFIENGKKKVIKFSVEKSLEEYEKLFFELIKKP